MTEPKYPDVEVQLTGEDGNVFGIIARIRKALRRAGVDAEEISQFTDEMTSGDYGDALSTASRWVTIS